MDKNSGDYVVSSSVPNMVHEHFPWKNEDFFMNPM